jgi:hypothetical protein
LMRKSDDSGRKVSAVTVVARAMSAEIRKRTDHRFWHYRY